MYRIRASHQHQNDFEFENTDSSKGERLLAHKEHNPASSSAFREFCDSTSLHGWHQLNRVGNHGKAAWVIIVFSSFTVASFFLATSIVDFVNRSVVTTIESTTASLQVQN